MYIELQAMLTKASKRQEPFQNLDYNLVHAVKAGITKFKDYVDFMKGSDIYFLATLLDRRVKTQWIKDNLGDVDVVIERLRKFLKSTYHREVESADEGDLYKSLEY
jgi:hypothetical protein